MDNLKKNIHFVVLGGGVLLGIILVVVGIMMRGGTEQELADMQTQLAPHANVYTKGTLDSVDNRSSGFESAVEEAGKAITGAKSFESEFRQHSSGQAFYTNEANAALRNLRERWSKLEGKDSMPGMASDWTIKRQSGLENADAFWDRLSGEIASPPVERVRDLQRQFRLLEEIVTTCEHLLAAGHGDGMGVKLLNFRAENFQPLTSNQVDSPWNVMQWDLVIECSPGFAALLFEELANPSPLTLAQKENMAKRRGFPNLPMILQTEMVERPAALKIDVSNDQKAGLLEALRAAGKQVPNVSQPSKLDPASNEGKQVSGAAVELLEGPQQILMPVRAGLRMRAASFNDTWRATATPEESN